MEITAVMVCTRRQSPLCACSTRILEKRKFSSRQTELLLKVYDNAKFF